MEELTIRERLAQSYTRYYRDQLGLPDWSDRVNKRLRLSAETKVVNRLVNLIGDLTSNTILDVGCGWGGTIVAISRMFPDVISCGLEPEFERADLARTFISSQNTKSLTLAAIGEQMPLKDNCVDVVCAYQVLEHVNDRREVVCEILRVLRPGGYFHTMLPNYSRFFESHYKVFWIPFMPKWLAKFYLRIRKRPTEFLSAFSYTTPWQIRRLFDPRECAYRDLVQEDLDAKLQDLLESDGGKLDQSRKAKLIRRLPHVLVKTILVVYRYLKVGNQEYLVRKHSQLASG